MKFLSSFVKTQLVVVLICFSNEVLSQFAGPVGQISSTAISFDDPSILTWGDSVSIQRGSQNLSNGSASLATYGDVLDALAQANSFVVSLGDGGSATYFFAIPIIDLTGFDFAVYENAFNDIFLELAFVEVSSDGVNFVRFPAVSNIQFQTQIGPFDEQGDATKIHNLAGKYRANYGTPFDLSELPVDPNLDLQAIHYVRIIDVVGSIDSNYASYDSNGNPINEPFPTEFASGGFDLDALAVLHQEGMSISELESKLSIFPNPVALGMTVHISGIDQEVDISIFDMQGRKIGTYSSLNFLAPNLPGNYFMQLQSGLELINHRLIVY